MQLRIFIGGREEKSKITYTTPCHNKLHRLPWIPATLDHSNSHPSHFLKMWVTVIINISIKTKKGKKIQEENRQKSRIKWWSRNLPRNRWKLWPQLIKENLNVSSHKVKSQGVYSKIKKKFHEQAELNGELEENEGFIRNNKHHYLLNIWTKG